MSKQIKNTPSITEGDLIRGLDNIEKYLGIAEGRSVFLNEYCISSASFPDLSEPADWVVGDTWSPYYLTPLMGNKAKLLTWQTPCDLDEYLENIDIIPRVRETIEMPFCTGIDRYWWNWETEKRLYPDGSIIGRLKKDHSEYLNDQMMGSVVIPSFVTDDVVDYAGSIGACTLILPKASIQFNSKSFLREQSETYDFRMAPGTVTKPYYPISIALRTLKTISDKNNIVFGQCWVKFSTAAGGGTSLIKDPTSEKIEKWVCDYFNQSVSGDKNSSLTKIEKYNDIPEAMQRDIVMELDIGTLPDTEIIGNYGLQAVIGENQIAYLGSTRQITEDGDYIGGETLSVSENDFVKTNLLPEVSKVVEAYWDQGYRGMMGVDALLTSQSGEYIPYILEANCRMTAATPLLCIVQKLKTTGGNSDLLGRLATFSIPATTDDLLNMGSVFNTIGSDIYKRGDVHGILPFMADTLPARNNMDTTRFRCVIIGQSANEIDDIQTRFQKRLTL